MSNLVYFSHSYRPRDAMVNDYFARLMEAEGLIPSLDPPSRNVNGAKLERHLGHTDAMIAVLTERESGVSPHILYEIGLSLRGRKPVLVFTEDTLPSTIVPANVLQRRFSIRSFPRNVREHRQSLITLRQYIGEAVPHYQGLLAPRTCLLIGVSTLAPEFGAAIERYIAQERRYTIVSSSDLVVMLDRNPVAYGIFGELSLAIAFTNESLRPREVQLVGEVRGAALPLISFTTTPLSPTETTVPVEYRPRVIAPGQGPEDLVAMIAAELEIYEQDFLELADSGSADRYTRFLIDLGGRGKYSPLTRERGVEVVVGDRYEVHGQAGAVGPDAHVHDVTFNQIWSQRSDGIDLDALADELARLRNALRADATTPDEDRVVADVGQAELAAKNGDGPAALRYLRSAGAWALETATRIGVEVATAAIRAATGF